jgi:hypothetical protein
MDFEKDIHKAPKGANVPPALLASIPDPHIKIRSFQ